MESSCGATMRNWTEALEDLLDNGDLDQAICFLESTITNLEKELKLEELQSKNGGDSSSSIPNQLSTALKHLSKLYDSSGHPLKADQTFARALEIKNGDSQAEKESQNNPEHGCDDDSSNSQNDGSHESCEVDDWEILADRSGDELFPRQTLPEISKLSLDDSETQISNRRGRGNFSYNKQGLYSDEPVTDEWEHNLPEDLDTRNLTYGTRHVLVLSNFPPSLGTIDLEKVFQKSEDSFVIRWVKDTTALAVFSSPSAANEATKSIQWSFDMRPLEKDDELLSIISPKDLEPALKRPPTSARTAHRMISHVIGTKLPSSFSSTQLREQEEERRHRIVSRQNMRNDAWGDDDDDDDNAN